MSSSTDKTNRRPLVAAGLLLGTGLGGFLDGIVMHQLLQIHNMLSARFPTIGVAPEKQVVHLEINMFWDGVFHLLTWIMTAGGVALLWHATGRSDVPRSSRALLGSMLLGWGLLNLVEGLLNHHLFHLHHVVESAGHSWWDIAFLASGLMLALVGTTFLWHRPLAAQSPRQFAK